MYKSIIFAFVVIFFVTGLTGAISLLLLKTAYPDKKTPLFILCPFYEGDKECCVKISCIVSILSVLGLSRRCKIMIADCNMDKKEREQLCASFTSLSGVEICRKEEISSRICKKGE